MANNIIWHNGAKLAVLCEDTPSELVYKKGGEVSCTMHYNCMWDKAATLIRLMPAHPTWPWLEFVQAKATREEAELTKVSIEYEGVDEDPSNTSSEKPTYALEGTASNEPIETNLNFPNFAGKWSDGPAGWHHGAKFVVTPENAPDLGRFLGFFPIAGAATLDRKCGLKTFRDAGFIYSQTTVYKHKVTEAIEIDMSNIGKTMVPPPSILLPKVNAPRNWLFIACDASSVGRGAKVVRKWQLSGPLGWDSDVYPAAPALPA